MGCVVCHSVHQLLQCRSAAALPTQLHNPPPRWVSQPPPCLGSSPPGFPTPHLLLVWMNVSSLSPWLSDFHTVRFSVSSGCFFVFKLSLCFFWLCKEAQCVYLCLRLGWKSFKVKIHLMNSRKECIYRYLAGCFVRVF